VTTLAVDGLCEEDFRRSIENRLREGKPHQALERLRRLIAPFAGEGRVLPERFATVTADELALTGWDSLEAAISAHDKPDRPITALSVAFGWPGEELPQPDPAGRLKPCIETGYFTDDSFPFSQSDRDDLLEGYSYHGCTWASDHEATDSTLGLAGIDDLNGALAALEARLLASDEPDEDEMRAGSLGACLLSVLLYEAVEAKIAAAGLPRPICVTTGSNGVYPYFDAPVAGFPEEARLAAEAEADELEALNAVPAPRFSSLLVVGIPRAKKRAVLVLEENEAETADRIAKLRGLNHAEALPEVAPVADLPDALPEFSPELAAASPLLTKKNPGHAWDFRDLLGPRDPDSPGDSDWPPPSEPVDHLLDDLWTQPPVEPEDEPLGEAPLDLVEESEPLFEEPEADLPPPPEWLEPEIDDPADEPLAPPHYLPGTDELAEPGFTSLGPSIQDQLARLIGAHVPSASSVEIAEPDPVTVFEPELEAESESADPNAYTGPFWPAGTDWFEDEAEEEPAVELEAVEAPVATGIWARLRSLIRRS
jgi:hypothetical protein